MADDFEVRVKGLAQVEANLISLGGVAGEKVMRTTMFFAMKPLWQQAVTNISVIPGGSGALAKATRRVALKTQDRATGSGSRFTIAVAPKLTDRTAIALANLVYHPRRPRRGVFWGHLVEWNVKHGATVTRGRLVFTRALQTRAAEVVSIFTQRIGVAVQRALKRQQPL